MHTFFHGYAHVYGKNIDTDQIYPGRYLDVTNPDQLAKHAMEGADPQFHTRCKPGDIVVAGTNFGCGSSREHAAICLKAAGVSVVVAESFARIFYRNAINIGLILVVCPAVSTHTSQGDLLSIHLEDSTLMNESTQSSYAFEPLSPYALNILRAGGIKALLGR